jgi:hypothetical protein
LFEAGFSQIDRIGANNDKVNVEANTIHYEHLADLLEHFREHELFRSSGAHGNVTERDTTEWIEGTTESEVVLFMERRAGAINNGE